MAVPAVTTQLTFEERARAEGLDYCLYAIKDPSTLQLNITKRCNLSCKHCHVDSGSERTEEMDEATLQACLEVFAAGPFVTLDITGGAPELHPHYRWLIEEAARIVRRKQATGLNARIITRTNAAILTLCDYEDLPQFWARHNIEVAASLPHYEERKTDRMRGPGVFEQVIAGLRALNAVGYCREIGGTAPGTAPGIAPGAALSAAPDSAPDTALSAALSTDSSSAPLILNIVVNPGGAFLPPSQASAEREYREELAGRYDIAFNSLLVITNNPVGRFWSFLESRGLLEEYAQKLSDAYNPATVEQIMCRSQISVDVDGRLYDCDFNQSLELPILKTEESSSAAHPDVSENSSPAEALSIFDLERDGLEAVSQRRIRTGEHCFACTAGAGSSCGGAIA